MSIILDAITLPDDLVWVDEFSSSLVKQTVTPTLSGALIIEEAAQQKGRRITLRGTEETAWITRGILNQLQTLKEQPGLTMSLDLHDRPFTVMFRRDQDPILARAIKEVADPQDSDYYSLTLRLMEV